MRDEDLPYFRLDGSVRIPVADLREWMATRTSSQNRTDKLTEKILENL